MDVLGKHLQRKIQERNSDTPLLRHSKRLFSELPKKKSWSSYTLIRVLVFIGGKLGNK